MLEYIDFASDVTMMCPFRFFKSFMSEIEEMPRILEVGWA